MKKEHQAPRMYSRAVGLTKESEVHLARIWKHSRNPRRQAWARDQLILGCLPIALKMVRQFLRAGVARLGVSPEDLIQAGALYVVHGITYWQPTGGCRLTTYVYRVVQQRMYLEISRRHMVRSPWKSTASQFVLDALMDAAGRLKGASLPITIPSLAQEAGVSEAVTARVWEMREWSYDHLHRPLYPSLGDKSILLEETLSSDLPSPEDSATQADRLEQIRGAFANFREGLDRQKRLVFDNMLREKPLTEEALAPNLPRLKGKGGRGVSRQAANFAKKAVLSDLRAFIEQHHPHLIPQHACPNTSHTTTTETERRP